MQASALLAQQQCDENAFAEVWKMNGHALRRNSAATSPVASFFLAGSITVNNYAMTVTVVHAPWSQRIGEIDVHVVRLHLVPQIWRLTSFNAGLVNASAAWIHCHCAIRFVTGRMWSAVIAAKKNVMKALAVIVR